MTAIVALIDQKKNVWVGGDSAGVSGQFINQRKDPKVFIKDGFIFGFTSSFRMGQILHYRFTPPERKNQSVETYMNTDFIEAVRGCFKQYSFGDNDTKKGGQFIVGYAGEIFLVDSDFQIGLLYDKYASVGAGYISCLGALYAIEKSELQFMMEPAEKITLALRAAEKHNTGVCGPFIIRCLENLNA